jgi:hypothetical protein
MSYSSNTSGIALPSATSSTSASRAAFAEF